MDAWKDEQVEKDGVGGSHQRKEEDGHEPKQRELNGQLPPAQRAALPASLVPEPNISICPPHEDDLMESRIAMKIVRERTAVMHQDITAQAPAASPPIKGRLCPFKHTPTPEDKAAKKQAMDAALVNEAIAVHIPRSANNSPTPTRRQVTPGAVPVAGFRGHGGDLSPDLEEMQTPQRSTPFEPEVPIRATLVRSVREPEPAFVEAQPMADSESEVEFGDIVRNKKICTMMAFGVCLIVALVAALCVGFAINRSGSEDDDQVTERLYLPPFADDLSAAVNGYINSGDPFNPFVKANQWALMHPNREDIPMERQKARFALVADYYALGGESWSQQNGWLDYDSHECDWHTSHPTSPCNEEQEFKVLNLTRNGLRGLPTGHVGDYVPMHTLDLSHNSVTGLPPTLISQKSQLAFVDVSNNLLQGKISAEVGWINDRLTILRLHNNRLAGDFALSMVPNAVEVDLSNNEFSGTLPNNFLANTLLRVLKVGGNQLEGTLPSSLGQLVQLNVFDCSGNQDLKGTIPTEMSNLPLQVLDISNTAISGSIPDEICRLEASEQLDLRADCDKLQCC